MQPGMKYCNGRTTKETPGEYPKATYIAGEKVRLVWPAKNHDAEDCTNPFIPDTAMKIYATMNTGVNGPEKALGNDRAANLQTDWRLIADFKSTNPRDQIGGKSTPEGFQRCPDFCGARGTDKAVCFQDMLVPSNLPQGEYTFLWYWIFNGGSGAYTTCFAATVTGGTVPSGTTASPQTTNGQGGTTASPSGTGLVSLRIQIKNTGGVFDQAKLVTAIKDQLSVKECEIVTLTFSGGNTNGQNTFDAFFGVSLQDSAYSAAETKAKSAAFATAIGAVTSGVNVITATKDAAVATTCQATTSSITRYTISMSIKVASTPTPQPGDLSAALNQTVVDNGAKGDVSCILQTSPTFVCVVVVFSVADVIKVSNMASLSNGAAIKTGLAKNLKVSGSTAAAKSEDFTVSGAPTNVQSSPTGAGSRVMPWVTFASMALFGVFLW